MEGLYKKQNKCGYQKFYLALMQERPEWTHISERDIYKLYKQKDWLRKKKAKEEVKRYEKENPGDMAHSDIKYLPKIDGEREYFQEVMDDATRMVSVCILEDKAAPTACVGLKTSFDNLSIDFSELLTDNGAETSYNCLPDNRKPKDKLHCVTQLLNKENIKHRFTKPMRPQTNGKSERLHKTLDDEVLTQIVFESKQDMYRAIGVWLKYYNEIRIHMSLRKTPLAKMLELNPDYIPPKTYLKIIKNPEK